MREAEARAKREAEELEGCTFAPVIHSKKKSTRSIVTKVIAVGDELLEVVDESEESKGRDLSTFLQD
jgi:hypothetical protein